MALVVIQDSLRPKQTVFPNREILQFSLIHQLPDLVLSDPTDPGKFFRRHQQGRGQSGSSGLLDSQS